MIVLGLWRKTHFPVVERACEHRDEQRELIRAAGNAAAKAARESTPFECAVECADVRVEYTLNTPDLT